MKKSRVEEIRNRYCPKKITILFVGESAPSENRFFYLRNTILYCAFFMAFRRVYGVKEDEFLEYFQKLGCFLYDLLPCGKKWSGKKKVASKKEKKQARADFREFIEERRPKMVVTIMKRISGVVESEIKKTNINTVFRNNLKFPRNSRSFCEYVKGLEEILREAIDLKILPKSILSKK